MMDCVNQVDPVVALARELGVTVDEPIPLRSTNNVLLWLRPSMVVAKISMRPDVAANELVIGKALAGAGAPVVPPAAGIGDRLYRLAGRDVTFWTYQPQDDSEPADPHLVGLGLFELHSALEELRSTIAMPSYEIQVGDALRALANHKFAPELPSDDRDVLHRALSFSRERLPTLANTDRVIHGSPHGMNILVVQGRPRFIDFETVQVGPIEWDIAHLEPEVANSYPAPFDADALALCRLAISATTSTWCWDGLDRGPDMRFHAENHLAIVRSQLQ
jgi:Phosphotransferase enzyme family